MLLSDLLQDALFAFHCRLNVSIDVEACSLRQKLLGALTAEIPGGGMSEFAYEGTFSILPFSFIKKWK